jgi:hypothetical protein
VNKARQLVGLAAVFVLLGLTSRAFAQQTSGDQQQPAPPANPSPPAPDTPPADPPQSDAKPAADEGTGSSANRIFGVLPNYTTVEGARPAAPVTNRQAFKMATADSFDPFVYPLFGFIAGFNHWQNEPPEWGGGWSGYGKRYGAAFADNTVCSLITTGVMPTLLQQDPRYFVLGKGNFARRAAYSASRSLVTHSRSGQKQFNLSEVGGTLVVATISNLYYPETQRTIEDTLTRWAMQAMWDTVANELKEFWPDIRRKFHGS